MYGPGCHAEYTAEPTGIQAREYGAFAAPNHPMRKSYSENPRRSSIRYIRGRILVTSCVHVRPMQTNVRQPQEALPNTFGLRTHWLLLLSSLYGLIVFFFFHKTKK